MDKPCRAYLEKGQTWHGGCLDVSPLPNRLFTTKVIVYCALTSPYLFRIGYSEASTVNLGVMNRKVLIIFVGAR